MFSNKPEQNIIIMLCVHGIPIVHSSLLHMKKLLNSSRIHFLLRKTDGFNFHEDSNIKQMY